MVSIRVSVLALLAIGMIASYQQASALKCYSCDSTTDEKCAGEPTKVESLECKKQVTKPTEKPTEPTEKPTEPTEKPTEPTEKPTEPTTSTTPSTTTSTTPSTTTSTTPSTTTSTTPSTTTSTTPSTTTSTTTSTTPSTTTSTTPSTTTSTTPSTTTSTTPSTTTSTTPSTTTSTTPSTTTSTTPSTTTSTTTENPDENQQPDINDLLPPVEVDYLLPSVEAVPKRFRRNVVSRAEPDFECYKLVFKNGDKEVTQRGCQEKQLGCDKLKEGKSGAECYACADNECNSSSSFSLGVMSILIPVGIVALFAR